MERLTWRNVAALLGAIREVYELRDLDDFPAHALRAVARLVDADRRSYNEVDVHRRRAALLTDPALDLRDGETIFNSHIAEHPLISHYRASGDGRPVKLSDFLSRNELHRLGLYGEFFRPLRVEHQIALSLPTSAGLVVGIALGRSCTDFTERDRMLLELLRHHLVRARENAEAVSALRRQAALVLEGVDTVGAGIVWVASDGRVALATRTARQWLDQYFGARRGPGLPGMLRRWARQQCDLGDVATPRAPLVIEREGKRLIVRLIQQSTRTLLLLEEQRTSLDARALARLGLTRREAEVLSWVARGKSDTDVATILGLSRRTVAKHLEHIFQKLGVETRTAAAVLAIEAARR
jgi:DNA-binding CsgD family transcriptional regulator